MEWRGSKAATRRRQLRNQQQLNTTNCNSPTQVRTSGKGYSFFLLLHDSVPWTHDGPGETETGIKQKSGRTITCRQCFVAAAVMAVAITLH